MFFLVALGALIFNGLTKMLFSRVGEGLTYSLRLAVFQKIILMPAYWFNMHENNLGTLSVRLLGTEVKNIKNIVSSVVDIKLSFLSSLTTALIISFANSWAITLITVALVPLQI
jgi:ABC-type multidrug transport system fused ATPase/permease subunit